MFSQDCIFEALSVPKKIAKMLNMERPHKLQSEIQAIVVLHLFLIFKSCWPRYKTKTNTPCTISICKYIRWKPLKYVEIYKNWIMGDAMRLGTWQSPAASFSVFIHNMVGRFRKNWSQKCRLRCRPNFCYVSLHVRFYFQQISSRLTEHPMSRQKKLRAFHLLSCKSNYGTKNMQQLFNTRHVLENRVSTGWVGSSQNDAESSWNCKWQQQNRMLGVKPNFVCVELPKPFGGVSFPSRCLS